jgi:hypothetical protein
VSDAALKAPFPWFGGKSRVAPLVWERFGDIAVYAEPFAGSTTAPRRSTATRTPRLRGRMAPRWHP